MSAPVDVLAVMDRFANNWDASGKSLNLGEVTEANQLREARSAVAELIEAANSAEAFISIAVPMLAVERHEAVRDILPTIRAALARCGCAP